MDEHRDITTTIGTITKRLVQLCTWPADDNGGICGRRAVATYIQWTFDGTGSMRYPRCRRHDTHRAKTHAESSGLMRVEHRS